jgi:hypothetical protein
VRIDFPDVRGPFPVEIWVHQVKLSPRRVLPDVFPMLVSRFRDVR